MSKRNKIIYWVFTLWLALGLVSTGLVQLFKGKEGAGGVDSVTQLGYPVYILALLGFWKFLAVVAILVPKFPVVKEWTYAGLFFMMTGALYSHVAAGGSFKDAVPALLMLVLAAISWYFRPAERKATSVGIGQ